MTASIREERGHQRMRDKGVGSPLRVLHLLNLNDQLTLGGAERFAVALVTNLPQDRFEPWICSPRGIEPYVARELREAGVRFVTLGRCAAWDVHRFAGLLSLLHRERIDVLHSHMFGSNFWGAIAGRACAVPAVIAHEHTWSYQGDPLRVWLDGRVIGRLVTRFVAVSNADAERMVRIEHVPPAKVVSIPTCYVPHPTSSNGDLRSELGLRPGTPLIATAAHLRPQKALEVLIDAHARLLQVMPDAHLVVAGDGRCRADLERHAVRLGVDESVHFLGARTDIDSILATADLAAISSDFEGMPLFALECMANNTPLVATAVGGLMELVDNGRTGVLVPRRNPQALAEALAALLRDTPRRERLAAAAFDRLDEFSVETITERFATLYETLISERRGGRRG